ncbi:MAG: pitrilysin family protein [Planctomycetaceae bacterium]
MFRTKWFPVIVVTACVAATNLLVPARAAAAAKLVTAIEGIAEFRLENGMRVLLFPDASRPTVTVNLTVFVGSRHEGYGEAGMAHLLEHMLFKGTAEHPNIPKALQDHGARFNGTTWVDRTNYYETLPAGKENLEFALKLEADRMMNSLIRAKDLASEMTVVRNEFERGENSPSRVLSQRMMAAAFEWHNYGRSTIGNRADIERVPVESLRPFYRKYYQPDNAMLIVAGKFDPRGGLAMIEKTFGAIPVPKRKLANTYTEEPAQDGERIVTLRRVGEVAVVSSLFHIPAGPHPDFVAVDMLTDILSSAPTGRLYKSLVETKRAASVEGSAYAFHDPGVVELTAEVNLGNDARDVLNALLDTIDAVAEKGVTAEEIKRTRSRFLRQREQAAANTSRLAIQLSEWAAQGDWRLYFLYRDRLEKVTADDVKRVAGAYFIATNRTVGLFLPTKSPTRVSVPATPDLARMIGNYKGRKAVAAGEAFDVSPQNIESHTVRYTMPGGLKVALLPKKTRGEVVSLLLTLRYGDLKTLQGRTIVGEFLPTLMTRGTKSHTRTQLTDTLAELRATVAGSGDRRSPGEASFSVQATRTTLPKVLELLGQVLRQPTLPEKELALMKQRALAGLEQEKSEPQPLALRKLRRTFRPYAKSDPRYEPTIAGEIAMVESLTREQIVELYKRFLGGAQGELAVVGDFDAKTIRPQLAALVGDWTARTGYRHIERRGDLPYKPGASKIQTPDKANAVYFAGIVFPMKDTHPDYPSLVMANYILGGGSLASRLGDRVRQKEGLSYGIRSYFNATSVDQRGSLTIAAISNPANVPRVVVVIQEEIQKLVKSGVTPAELAAAQKGYLQSSRVGRTSDGRLTGILAESLFANRTLAHQAELEKQVASTTTRGVLAAVRKYFNPSKLVVVTAGDFNKKSAPATKTPGKKKSKSKAP